MGKKLTTEQFIEKAKAVHGDTYDYSLVDYVGTKTKVKIICKNHGVFEQKPEFHIKLCTGSGCPLCGVHNRTMLNTTTLNNFVKKANDIHQDKYNYSLVVYKNAHTKVKIICKIHGEFNQTPSDHTNKQCGCPECAVGNRAKTNFNKYGHSNYLASIQGKKHSIDSTLARYGVEYFNNPSQRTNTNLAKYGSVSPFGCIITQQKSKQTMIQRYGVEYSGQSVDVQLKKKRTCLSKYGHENAFKNIEFQQKQRQSVQRKYGVDNVLKVRGVRDRIKNTSLKKYGVTHYSQHHMIDSLDILESAEALVLLYHTHSYDVHLVAKTIKVSSTTIYKYLHKHSIPIHYTHGFSKKAISWMEQIMNTTGIYIQHKLTEGGEYKIPGTPYSADGYCATTNTIYEFYGNGWHGNPSVFTKTDKCHPKDKQVTAGELYQQTIERENKIKTLGYNLVVIWESDWNEQQRLSKNK